MQAMILAIELYKCIQLVRIFGKDTSQVKPVLDAGAYGIIVPMVNKRTDAEKAVEAVHYAPHGNRGVGLARAQGYGDQFNEYVEWQEEGPVVIVQIEHRDALSHLDAIMTVPGVDGFIIGPYDLSCSLGISGEFENTEFTEAMELIKKTGIKLEVPCGIHIVEPDTEILTQSFRDGYRFIAYSVDIRILDVGLRRGMNCFNEICR